MNPTDTQTLFDLLANLREIGSIISGLLLSIIFILGMDRLLPK